MALQAGEMGAQLDLLRRERLEVDGLVALAPVLTSAGVFSLITNNFKLNSPQVVTWGLGGEDVQNSVSSGPRLAG